MIELYLSSDGKHTVKISAQDREEMDKLAPYARGLYEKVLSAYGTKAQMWGEAMNGDAKRQKANGNANGQSRRGKRVDTPEQAREAFAPRCPEHGVPMRYRQGRYGAFWSCARKDADGNWCSYTRDVSRSDNGHAVAA